MRLNVGSGTFKIIHEEWVNLDQNPAMRAQITADAIEHLESCEAGTYEEIYAGHFLEHLTPADARRFLDLAYAALEPGGNLGILVPDIYEVCRRYVINSVDEVQYPLGTWEPIASIDTLNKIFFYSTVQASPHRWMWDQQSLSVAMREAGFEGLREIDRYRDERLGTGAWYQMGFDGWKPGEDTNG